MECNAEAESRIPFVTDIMVGRLDPDLKGLIIIIILQYATTTRHN